MKSDFPHKYAYCTRPLKINPGREITSQRSLFDIRRRLEAVMEQKNQKRGEAAWLWGVHALLFLHEAPIALQNALPHHSCLYGHSEPCKNHGHEARDFSSNWHGHNVKNENLTDLNGVAHHLSPFIRHSINQFNHVLQILSTYATSGIN